MRIRQKLLIYTALVFFCTSCSLVSGAGFYVASSGIDEGNDDGTSWETAFATISNALAKVAGANTNVWVGNGTYEITAEIQLDKEAAIIGVGGAQETTVQVTATGCRAFSLTHQGALLDGLTIRNGNLTSGFGAGVYMDKGRVQNCIIFKNKAKGTSSGAGGGGIYLIDGVVSNCEIKENIMESTGARGAGVYMSGGLLQACLISGNIINPSAGSGSGGGVFIANGRVENCLVISNYGVGQGGTTQGGGGGIWITNGTVVNSTIVGNWARSDSKGGAGVYRQNKGTLTNCIIWHNMNIGSQAKIDLNGTADWSSGFFYCCSPDLPDGFQGNISSDPLLSDWRQGNCRLPPYSPCVNAGTDTGLAFDIDGNPRPQDGHGSQTPAYDMGAYERNDAGSYFNCYFSVSTNQAFNDLEAVFSASVFGPNTDGLHYSWDFGNGTQEGSDLASVTHGFGLGLYSVSLTVRNSLGDEACWSVPGLIRVIGPDVYVAVDGGNIAPYDTWEKASVSILDAVNAAIVTTAGAARVVVANGTYNILKPDDSVFIDKGITVTSLNGASNTVVWGDKGKTNVYANFDLDHPDAVLDGFTTGNAEYGLYVHRGTVRNCIARHNVGTTTRKTAPLFDGSQNFLGGRGAGMRLMGGLVENCQIFSNAVSGTWSVGAGLWMGGNAHVQNCIIAYNNIPSSSNIKAGGVYMENGVLRNCLVYSNRIHAANETTGAFGGGVYVSGNALMENCTVVNNNVAQSKIEAGAGVCSAGSPVIRNSIAWYNTLHDTTPNNAVGVLAGFSYSCAPELSSGENGNIPDDPCFADSLKNNYRFYKGSPCIDAGINQEWMFSALDLRGAPRIVGNAVDMGAYEAPLPLTIFTFY